MLNVNTGSIFFYANKYIKHSLFCQGVFWGRHGTGNKHGIPLVELKAFGKKGAEAVELITPPEMISSGVESLPSPSAPAWL